MDERERLARLIDPFSQGAPSNEAGEAADRILAEIAAAERRGWEQGRDAAAEVAESDWNTPDYLRNTPARIRELTHPDQMRRAVGDLATSSGERRAPASPRQEPTPKYTNCEDCGRYHTEWTACDEFDGAPDDD